MRPGFSINLGSNSSSSIDSKTVDIVLNYLSSLFFSVAYEGTYVAGSGEEIPADQPELVIS